MWPGHSYSRSSRINGPQLPNRVEYLFPHPSFSTKSQFRVGGTSRRSDPAAFPVMPNSGSGAMMVPMMVGGPYQLVGHSLLLGR